MPGFQLPSAIGEAEIVLDQDGRVLSVSATQDSRRLVAGVTAGETLLDHIHSDDYDFFQSSAQWIGNHPGRQQTIQLRWARANGRWANVNAKLRGEAAGSVIVAFRPDEIEHAKRAESQLRRIVEDSAQGIVVRTNTDVLYTNDAFAHLLGYASTTELAAAFEGDIAAGRDPHLMNAIHRADMPLVAEHMRRRLAGEETVSNYEFRLIRADGSPVWVDTRAALVQWDGRPASLAWMSDINHRKRLELELIKSKDAAEFANRTKTEFLANMSHELRTPLNAIIGFAEVIRDEMFGPVGLKKYVEYARDIHVSGRHLLDMINDILDLSKLEAGKLELHEKEVALEAAIRECLTLVQDRAEKGSVALTTEIEPGLPPLLCDERAVKQILLNFLSNAVKFTPAGGTVIVGARRTDGGMALLVRDTGIGMDAGDIDVALAAFGQIDSKIARQHQGTGLGLPISKSLIELHGGMLSVESAPGKGTTMTAVFPAWRVDAAAAA